MKHCEHLRICPGRFAFAFGLLWAIGWLLVGWAGWKWGYGVPLINVMGSVYYGYAPTLLGGVYGAIWGFIDAFIFCFLAILVYNGCCCRRCSHCETTEKTTT